VVPPRTGGNEPERPPRVAPFWVILAKTCIFPRIVETEATENDPSAAVVAESEPTVVTVAPLTGLPLLSRTMPETVVPGSGITGTCTGAAVPVGSRSPWRSH